MMFAHEKQVNQLPIYVMGAGYRDPRLAHVPSQSLLLHRPEKGLHFMELMVPFSVGNLKFFLRHVRLISHRRGVGDLGSLQSLIGRSLIVVVAKGVELCHESLL